MLFFVACSFFFSFVVLFLFEVPVRQSYEVYELFCFHESCSFSFIFFFLQTQKGEKDWSPPVIVQKKINIIRDKEASTEIAFWRHDPRLEGYDVEEMPIPQLDFEDGKGCGIRVDMNMMITNLRAGRWVLCCSQKKK